jgi:hypothetical protein
MNVARCQLTCASVAMTTLDLSLMGTPSESFWEDFECTPDPAFEEWLCTLDGCEDKTELEEVDKHVPLWNFIAHISREPDKKQKQNQTIQEQYDHNAWDGLGHLDDLDDDAAAMDRTRSRLEEVEMKKLQAKCFDAAVRAQHIVCATVAVLCGEHGEPHLYFESCVIML